MTRQSEKHKTQRKPSIHNEADQSWYSLGMGLDKSSEKKATHLTGSIEMMQLSIHIGFNLMIIVLAIIALIGLGNLVISHITRTSSD